MSAEWIVNPPGNPSTPPFRVTQRGGGKLEMAFIGCTFFQTHGIMLALILTV
jgi:hypothetical protein